ncbi:hypothetical protein SLEP1_g53104 [Rubroshorea leprosula]|uniref:Uncharacterized protein n=1 Tax=Rubroshorea leprosula TaxID=152421 RepID=A0AAV5MC84_9ROSI|nr:hypothetical protein SLEP1_g53104 [Rubroshorea leprosula]
MPNRQQQIFSRKNFPSSSTVPSFTGLHPIVFTHRHRPSLAIQGKSSSFLVG